MLGVFSGVMHRLLGRQADLLRRVRGLRLLWLAAFGSGIGTWLAFVALTVDVWDRTHSGNWVAALLIADFLPAIILGLTVGPLIDRYSRRRVMVAADIVRFAVFCALPFASSAGQIVAFAAIAGCATGFFRPAVYAGLPNLVKDEELPSAQGLLQAGDALTTVLGPLIGGVLVAATSTDWAYAINAVTFLYSAALILRIPPHLLQVAQAATQGHWRDVAEGLKLIRGSRALLTVLIAWNVGMLGNAGVNVAEVVLAKVSFDAGDFGYGLMLASAGFGLVVREPERRRLDRAPGHRGRVRHGLRPDGDRDRGGGRGAQRLDRRGLRRPLRGRERDRDRLQRAARPARGAGPAARARVHRAHELELPRARPGDDRCRAAHERVRRALGLGRLGVPLRSCGARRVHDGPRESATCA